MTSQQIYEELKIVAEQKGLPVRLEMGDFDGGICTVKERRVILINRRHDLPRRVHVIARALYASGLDDVFVKPAIREIIDDEMARTRVN
ncbi:MAG: hypothetical protein H7X80_06370 [bacterium]|nr:hypothetical protein [Candidatus Kapabacteria bacterium]